MWVILNGVIAKLLTTASAKVKNHLPQCFECITKNCHKYLVQHQSNMEHEVTNTLYTSILPFHVEE